MKSVKEIKDFKDRNRTASINAQQDYNLFVINALIGITERIDAMEHPTTRVEHVGTYAPITTEERAAMIKALRWACDHGLAAMDVMSAITRLENGGDL